MNPPLSFFSSTKTLVYSTLGFPYFFRVFLLPLGFYYFYFFFSSSSSRVFFLLLLSHSLLALFFLGFLFYLWKKNYICGCAWICICEITSPMDTRKRGRPEAAFNANGGFKKSKQGSYFLSLSRSLPIMTCSNAVLLCLVSEKVAENCDVLVLL